MDLIKTSTNTSKCRRRNLKKRWDFTSFRTKTVDYQGTLGQGPCQPPSPPLPKLVLGRKKKILLNIYITYQRNKSSWKICYCSSLNIISPLKRGRQNGFNANVKIKLYDETKMQILKSKPNKISWCNLI
jgi:hypothetical protein